MRSRKLTQVDSRVHSRQVQKRLNTDSVKIALEHKGISAAAAARDLQVSREAVSKWLAGEAFPRPDKLLRLSSLAGLSFSSLVIAEDDATPRVAFRKKGNAKTTLAHIQNAQEMGRMLRSLVPYLHARTLTAPPVLKDPTTDYAYLHAVVTSVRSSMGVAQTDPIVFAQLVKRFSELQVILIPVLWGKKNRHENATHIHLPDSATTWVYLNLDVEAHDFLFWISHELGHSLSPSLEGNAAEDFADAFAGALLFPHEVAETLYGEIVGLPQSVQMKAVIQRAQQYAVSPFCIEKQLNAYARSAALDEIDLRASIGGATTNFNKRYHSVSSAVFDGHPPEPGVYIKASKEHFETEFFDVLRAYLRESGKGFGFVQTVLDLGTVDAKGIYAELS
jgi:transcriptional regulator with XRE-family HTH domain